jgi:hypothetical protein
MLRFRRRPWLFFDFTAMGEGKPHLSSCTGTACRARSFPSAGIQGSLCEPGSRQEARVSQSQSHIIFSEHPGQSAIEQLLVPNFDRKLPTCVLRLLQTTTWDKTVVDRTEDLANCVELFRHFKKRM